ncbi:MAG: PSD1 and planctomycete cytochrome C domain-containing protein [Pirellulales bacterium]|nr:PSD1 and planctomycete cytochrome C domain-containing protein [Pirellulales bacterium]
MRVLWIILRSLGVVLCGIIFTKARLALAEPPDYLQQIKPILRQRCFACHSGLKAEGGLRLDAASFINKGGDSGPALLAGQSEKSELIARVTSHDESERMPQEGAELPEAEIQILKQWIDQGAALPEEPLPPDPLTHWSFVAPRRPPIPPQSDHSPLAASANPVDRFIAARQNALGVTPLPPADKAELLRRVTLDLTGLPPTTAEMQAFMADSSPVAYTAVVDRLLASPRYAERWGRHWMDVWRYSDWDGFGAEVRESQPHIWRWRDWIIQSLADDKPYNQMLVEMLAGDELAPADPDILRATGFLARNYHRYSRNTWLENTIEHTGKAFLGLTLNCARCHDHKYDPISQAEYYQLRAVFEPYDVRIDPLPGAIDPVAGGLSRVYDARPEQPTYLFERGNEKQPDTEHPLIASLPRILGERKLAAEQRELPVTAWYPAVARSFQNDFLAQKEATLSAARAELATARADWDKHRAAPSPTVPAPPATATLADQAKIVAPDRGEKFLWDNFLRRDTELWLYDRGNWELTGQGVRQTDPAADFCLMISQSQHPADFVARYAFTIRGGDGYRSVGLAFDLTDKDNFQAYYLTAFPDNPGSQFLQRVRGADTYPSGTHRAFPVNVDSPQEVILAVRGQLVNVWVGGKFLLAYQLPQPRAAGGKLALWTFDAVADFHQISVEELSPEVALVPATLPDSGDKAIAQPEDPVLTQLRLQQRVELASAKLALAAADELSTRARMAADQLRYMVPREEAPSDATSTPTPAVTDAISVAVRAEAAEKTAAAQLKLVTARHELSLAATKAENASTLPKLQEAVAQAEQAVQTLAAQAPAADYAPLGPQYPKSSTGRRLALARRIADNQNPLTARVAVNHLWLRHFGAPLVPTMFDYGHNGKPPTHPELLDWLAVEFMEGGWRMRPLHRLIVTSQAYQMASHGSEELTSQNMRLDRDNQALWRMNSRRLEAEAVRDAVLYVSGRLDFTAGGPDLDQNAAFENPRRSLYFRQAKEKRVPFLAIFDQANVAECYRRDETIVPQQALALANSELVAAAAEQTTKKLEQLAGKVPSDPEFVERAFKAILNRAPTSAELERCLRFLALVPSVEHPQPASANHSRRQSLVHVLFNHHEFVTIP